MTVLSARAAASPLLVGAARLWIAAVLLLVAMLLTGDDPFVDGATPCPRHADSHRLAPRVGRAAASHSHGGHRPHGTRYNDIWRCVLMGGCLAGYQAAYFTAVTLSGISVTALIAICSAPLMIATLAPRVLGEPLTSRVRVALALGVVGTALLVAAPHGTLDLTARLVAGALLLSPALLWTEAPVRQIALGWPWLLYLGGVATAGAYAIYALGLRHVPASVSGIVTLMEPLTATLLGVLLFGERLGAPGGFGALLLCSALGLVLARRTVSAAL